MESQEDMKKRLSARGPRKAKAQKAEPKAKAQAAPKTQPKAAE